MHHGYNDVMPNRFRAAKAGRPGGAGRARREAKEAFNTDEHG
jgi:hypothetical protein